MHKSSLKRMESFVENYCFNSVGVKRRIPDVGSYDVNGTYKALFS